MADSRGKHEYPLEEKERLHSDIQKGPQGQESQLQVSIQWTKVIMTLFVTKDLAVKSNLLF